jgi:hypothetical protein
MIKRYFQALSSSIYTFFFSNTQYATTGQTASWHTVVNGTGTASVTFKVITLSMSNPAGALKINGAFYNLNDTFNVVLSGGTTTLDWFLDVGTSTPGNAINSVLQIIAVSVGQIGGINTQGNEIVI